MIRLSSTFLLLGVIAAGAAMLNCSADDPSEDASSDVAAVTGLGNPVGLRLVYDERTSTVRARVQQKLEPDQRLRLRVRRGRLSAQSPLELDCSRLPDAPALAPTSTTTSALSAGAAVGAAVTYQGPVVDPSLLATVYDEQWILDHVTPKMLEELQTQGADSIVEACVMKGAAIDARVQTSLATAWDQADPLLAYAHSTPDSIDTTAQVVIASKKP